jgi:hypothetical protein
MKKSVLSLRHKNKKGCLKVEIKRELGALNIQLFAEGGAVGEGAGVGDSQTGENNAEVNGGNPDAGDNGASQNGEVSADEVTLDGIFEKYPELKKEADKRTNKAVQGRVHQMNKSMQKSDAVMQKLMVRYGVNDIDALNAVLDSDEVFEALAAERGENPDTMRELEKLKVYQRQMEFQKKQEELDRKANETYNGWMREAEPLKERYPDFNLENELQNPEFGKLLQRGIPMEHAYKLLHHDELIAAAEKSAAEKISKNVQSRAARPSENGLGNQSGVVVKSDVHKLTKKDRADLAKRAARGERIEF